MARSTRLVILIKNIYTLRFLLPVAYFPTNLVYPFTLRVTGIKIWTWWSEKSILSLGISNWGTKGWPTSYYNRSTYLQDRKHRIQRFSLSLFRLTYYSGWVALLAPMSPRADSRSCWWCSTWLVDALTRWSLASLTTCFRFVARDAPGVSLPCSFADAWTRWPLASLTQFSGPVARDPLDSVRSQTQRDRPYRLRAASPF